MSLACARNGLAARAGWPPGTVPASQLRLVAEQPGYEQTVDLKAGLRAHVRPIRLEDEVLLHEAFAAMSERSVYLRFFSPLKRLPEKLAHRLAEVDQQDRFALVATSHLPEHRERILGVARYDRIPATDIAEVAVAVIDEMQRRGVGATLLGLVAMAGRDHGIRSFVLVVLPENQSMFNLLRKLGWIHRAKFTGGVYEISFDI